MSLRTSPRDPAVYGSSSSATAVGSSASPMTRRRSFPTAQLPNVANSVVEYVPTARPGSRAPHMWLQKGNQQISTLDLYDTHFVLLTGPAGEAWRTAGQWVADSLGIPLRSCEIGPNGPLVDRTAEWEKLYGVGPRGAVLVRPDGHVAWRMPDAESNPETRLAVAFYRILSLDSANDMEVADVGLGS